MEMKMKRALVQCTLTMMVNCDVQNTEGDYDRIQSFVRQCVFGYHDILKEDLDSVEQVAVGVWTQRQFESRLLSL